MLPPPSRQCRGSMSSKAVAGGADSEPQTVDVAPCRMRLVWNDVYPTGRRPGQNGKRPKPLMNGHTVYGDNSEGGSGGCSSPLLPSL